MVSGEKLLGITLLVSRVGENSHLPTLLDFKAPPIGINDTEDWMLRLSKTRIRLEARGLSAQIFLSLIRVG